MLDTPNNLILIIKPSHWVIDLESDVHEQWSLMAAIRVQLISHRHYNNVCPFYTTASMAVNKDNPGVFANELGNYIAKYNVISSSMQTQVSEGTHTCAFRYC